MKTSTLFALSLLNFASSMYAEVITISGTTVDSATYNRVYGSSTFTLSDIGTDVNYFVIPFTVGDDGLYRMEIVETTGFSDTTLTLYLESFNPEASLENAIAYDDDSGVDFLSLLELELSATEQYLAVVASYSNGDSGTFTFEIEGSSISLELIYAFLDPLDALYAAFALPNLGHSIAQASVSDLGEHLQQLQFQHVDKAGNLQSMFPQIDQSRQWSLWTQGSFGRFEQSRDNWSSDSDIYTGTVGADYYFSKTFTAGYAMGHAEVSADLGDDAGDIDSNGEFAAIYASYQQGDFYAYGLYSYGMHSMDLNRKTTTEVNKTNGIDAQTHSVNLTGGYNMFWNRVSFGPVASIKYDQVQTASYSEPNSEYKIEEQTLESLTSQFGAQASYTFYTDSGLIIPQIKALWVHEFVDDSENVDLSGAAIVTSERTSPYDEDYYIAGIGLHWQSLNKPLKIGISFENQLREGDNDVNIASIFGSWAW
jgi:uncharacterized protein YhjY with autotransporter beta-barrel domain